ncbi:MAG: TetR/AcrR family transcriptional regulator [Alphaproteobacteria bacterium]|nr:TetR/AcrR family transcriptional regulator [Alphaproteobacteria bacterium]
MASPRREQLIETAARLFNANGYHATGIDRILAEAGVAKMTLYNHFRSKDELILAVLRRRDETFRNMLFRAVEGRADTAREQLLAIFDVLEEWFRSKDFRGCMFINASAEYSAPDSAIRAASCEHKRLLTSYIEELARKAAAEEPAGLAGQIMLLIEGAIVSAQINCDCAPAQRAKSAAATLIAAAIPAN